jgi:polysaccharide chain length determinant protein (PEP-CTERM system associated)
MVRNGQIALADIKRILHKYWWIVPLMSFFLCAMGYAATVVLPKKYTSSTLILVEQPVVPTELVKPVVSDDLNQRLATMKEQLLSRTSLQSIIEKFNLFPLERNKVHIEDLDDRLRRVVDVELIAPFAGTANRQPPGFHVSVTFDDPHMAQQICTEVTSLILSQNATGRMNKAKGVSVFVDQHLAEAKANLDDQEAKLAHFQQLNLGSLPDSEQTNLSLLAGMNTQLEAATQALNRAQQDKAFTETMLNQQESNWRATTSGQQNPETQDMQLAALQDQLTNLLAKYTPEHPDVIKLKTQIEDLKRRAAAVPPPKASGAVAAAQLHDPPQIQQLRAKLKQDELNIADTAKRQFRIQEQIRVLQGRVQSSPMVEQQFKELTRNHQTALDIYNGLLKAQQDSQMTQDIEKTQQSETFKVLDEASLPNSPSFPNKLKFCGGGFAAGIVLSLGLMYLLAILDKSMYSERDVEVSLKLPVLTSVPSFDVLDHGGAKFVRHSEVPVSRP